MLDFSSSPTDGQFFHCQIHGLQRQPYETYSCSLSTSSAPRQQYFPKLIPKLLRTWQTQTILLHFRAIYKLFLRKNYSHLSYCQHGHIFVPCSWPAIPLVKSHTFDTKHPRVAPHGMYSPCLSPAFWNSGPTSGYLLLS